MTVAALDKELYSRIEHLNGAQKKFLLSYIKTNFQSEEEEEVYTIEQYNRELEEAEAEIERGEFYTHEEAKKLIKERLLEGKAKRQSIGFYKGTSYRNVLFTFILL